MTDLSGSTLLGRYRVDAFIARGGMADVYRGFDTQRHATLALKLMRPDFALDPDFERRFRREANTLAKLSHPNIVRYYDLERDGKELFMVMDYIDGISLQEHLFLNGPILSPSEVIAILSPVARALEYAHGQGVIHRDIKPSNIMISTDGEIFLTDFGIAKLVESATVTSVMAGTPAYMSPEQCANNDLNSYSDQYSLAVLAYEMLAGRRPFLGDSTDITTGTIGERIRVEHLSAVPVPPSQHNTDLTIAIDQVLSRALAKRPDARYNSTTAFVDAIKKLLPDIVPTIPQITIEKPPAREPPALTIIKDIARRRKILVWTIGSVIAAATLLYGISNLNTNSPPVEPSPTTAPTTATALTTPTAIPTNTPINTVPPTTTSTATPQPVAAENGLLTIINNSCSSKHIEIDDKLAFELADKKSFKAMLTFGDHRLRICSISAQQGRHDCEDALIIIKTISPEYNIQPISGLTCKTPTNANTSTIQPTPTASHTSTPTSTSTATSRPIIFEEPTLTNTPTPSPLPENACLNFGEWTGCGGKPGELICSSVEVGYCQEDNTWICKLDTATCDPTETPIPQNNTQGTTNSSTGSGGCHDAGSGYGELCAGDTHTITEACGIWTCTVVDETAQAGEYIYGCDFDMLWCSLNSDPPYPY